MRKYGQYLYQYLANQNKMGSDTKMYMRGEPTFFCGVCSTDASQSMVLFTVIDYRVTIFCVIYLFLLLNGCVCVCGI